MTFLRVECEYRSDLALQQCMVELKGFFRWRATIQRSADSQCRRSGFVGVQDGAVLEVAAPEVIDAVVEE
jgi:hypothetical protein